MVGFPPHSVGHVETVEDLERAALQTVGLAVEDLAGKLACVGTYDTIQIPSSLSCR